MVVPARTQSKGRGVKLSNIVGRLREAIKIVYLQELNPAFIIL